MSTDALEELEEWGSVLRTSKHYFLNVQLLQVQGPAALSSSLGPMVFLMFSSGFSLQIILPFFTNLLYLLVSSAPIHNFGLQAAIMISLVLDEISGGDSIIN